MVNGKDQLRYPLYYYIILMIRTQEHKKNYYDLNPEAAEAASRAAELARQKAVEAAEKAKLEAANRVASKTPTRGRGILKNTVPAGSSRGRGTTTSQTASVRGRGGITRGTRGTTGSSSSSARGGTVRGRGSLVRG